MAFLPQLDARLSLIEQRLLALEHKVEVASASRCDCRRDAEMTGRSSQTRGESSPEHGKLAGTSRGAEHADANPSCSTAESTMGCTVALDTEHSEKRPLPDGFADKSIDSSALESLLSGFRLSSEAGAAESLLSAFGPPVPSQLQSSSLASSIPMAALGPDPAQQPSNVYPDTTKIMADAAMQNFAQGNYQAAELLFEECLQGQRESLGPDHPDVAKTLNNLAMVFKVQGNCTVAESLLEESLRILTQRFGNEHPNVASCLNNLAVLHQSQGNLPAAVALCEESSRILRHHHGAHHLEVAKSLSSLGSLYVAQGRHGAAEPVLREALRIRMLQLGSDHPDVAISLKELTAVRVAQGRV